VNIAVFTSRHDYKTVLGLLCEAFFALPLAFGLLS
jgi:hypothetical protein